MHCRADLNDAPGKPITLPALSVSDLMVRDIACIRADEMLEAALRLVEEGTSAAVPVVDPLGHFQGCVSREELRRTFEILPRELALVMRVSDIVRGVAVVVPEGTSLTQAAAVMALEGEHTLGVMSTDGAIVGMIAAADILYWLARSDGLVLGPPAVRGR